MTRLAIDEWRTLTGTGRRRGGAMTRLAIDDMPVEYAKQRVASSAQAHPALRRWDPESSPTSLEQLRGLDPTASGEVRVGVSPAQPEKGSSRVSGNVHAEF